MRPVSSMDARQSPDASGWRSPCTVGGAEVLMRFFSLSFAALIPLFLGCAHAAQQPPATWAGADGIRVSVAGEKCAVLTDPDFVDNDLVEVSLSLAITNASPQQVSLHRDRLRLIAPDGVAPYPSTWGASTPIAISPGETTRVRVGFVNRGSLRCDAPLDLNLQDAVTSGDTTVTSGRIRLLAQR